MFFLSISTFIGYLLGVSFMSGRYKSEFGQLAVEGQLLVTLKLCVSDWWILIEYDVDYSINFVQKPPFVLYW